MRTNRKNNKLLRASVSSLLSFIFLISLAHFGHAEVKWPDRLVIAAASAGTTNYMISVGMGEVIKKHTPIKTVQVLPLGGPIVWGPMIKKGEVDLAIQNGANMIDVFLGQKDFNKIGPIPVRTLIGGHSFPFMFHTTPDKNINTIADLKNKVVYASLMGDPMFLEMAQAQLASAGLSLKSLKSWSTMPSVAQATNHLIEGKIDAFLYPVVPVSVHQINQAKGECVFVNLTNDQADYVEKNAPGYFKAVIPAGQFANKKEMRYAVAFQTCLHGRGDMDPEVAYQLVKVLLDHHNEWVGAHPQAKGWGLDKKPVTMAAEPYHPGAIKYYQEKKLWTKEVQEHNDKLLQLLQKK
ncbi:MAG TPA: TAXI family TRAP transporter solute-binding subunit [Syntrophorhabdaceae bacterium]|nr:TAXI family TRAP transporter solute-binding subunit [Syntrophorhabdaceae bacterium]